MFLYPERTRKDRIVPKNKVYGNAQPSRALRQRFVSEVDQIIWRNLLVAETVNLPSRSDIEGIQIFEIALRTGELKEDVLRSLDRAIPWRLFFELTFQGQVRFAAAYKRVSEGGGTRPVVEDYFLTPWQPGDTPRLPLPVALDLGSLYDQMLRLHILASPLGIGNRPTETIAETVGRAHAIRAKRRECQKLEIALKRENQFNRKVEINAALRQASRELKKLEAAAVPQREASARG